MINAPNDVWVEEGGSVYRVDVELDEVPIRSAIEILASLVGKEASEGGGASIIDGRIEGMRIAAALPPVAVRGPSICIRKHSTLVKELDDYVREGFFDESIKEYLIKAVLSRKNILVAGGTTSGKTTFLNALCAVIPDKERVVTIEDTQELKVKKPDYVSFESNDQEGIRIRDLLRLSLRYRPDRILVGEVRGGEAFDLMQAMNTGHDGGFATIHSSSAHLALARLEALVLTAPDVDWPLEAIRMQIGGTFDIIIYLARNEHTKRRELREILEINGFDIEGKCYDTKRIK